MSSARKKPRCHTCKGYMAGHRRIGGVNICPTDSPESSLISPPPSPERDPTASTSTATSSQPQSMPSSNEIRTPKPLRRPTSPIEDELEFSPLPAGGMVRRNPHWTGSSVYSIDLERPTPPAQQFQVGAQPTKRRTGVFRAPSLVSTVPTVLVDDEGRTIYESGSDSWVADGFENASFTSDSSASTIRTNQHGAGPQTPTPAPLKRQDSWFSKVAGYAKNNRFSVSILQAGSDNEYAEYRQKAHRHGLHIEPVNPFNPSFKAIQEEEEDDGSGKKVVVIGQQASFVHQIASTGFDSPVKGDRIMPSPELRRRSPLIKQSQMASQDPVGMPGTLVNGPPPTSNNTLSHFLLPLLASIVGGCIVVYGMSYIPMPASASATIQL